MQVPFFILSIVLIVAAIALLLKGVKFENITLSGLGFVVFSSIFCILPAMKPEKNLNKASPYFSRKCQQGNII